MLIYLRMAPQIQIAGHLSVSVAIVPLSHEEDLMVNTSPFYIAAPIVSGMIACMMATYRDSVSTSGGILSFDDVKSNVLCWARTSTQKYHEAYYKIAFNQGPYQK